MPVRRPTMNALGLGALLAIWPASELVAQFTARLDAGSGTMRVGSESPSGVLRVGPAVGFSTSILRVAAEGEYAGHTESGWQTTGKLTGSIGRRVGLLEGRLGTEAAWSRTRWGRSGAGWLGEARVQLASEHRGFALTAGRGHSFTPKGTQPLSRIEAGGWSRFGRLDLGLWLKRTGLTAPHDESVTANPRDTMALGDQAGRRTLQDHYTDVEATLGWGHGAFAFEAGAGRRFGKVLRFTSWHARATYQFTPRVAFIATGGQFPVDLVSGLPSGSFATVSMRFSLGAESEAPSRRNQPPAKAPLSFLSVAHPDGTRLVSVHAPQANSVEVMGDFTDWLPVLLVPGADDTWRLRMRITPGIHEVNLRIDGGPWTVPSGLPAVDDGLGGTAGVFLVE